MVIKMYGNINIILDKFVFFVIVLKNVYKIVKVFYVKI